MDEDLNFQNHYETSEETRMANVVLLKSIGFVISDNRGWSDISKIMCPWEQEINIEAKGGKKGLSRDDRNLWAGLGQAFNDKVNMGLDSWIISGSPKEVAIPGPTSARGRSVTNYIQLEFVAGIIHISDIPRVFSNKEAYENEKQFQKSRWINK